MPHSDPPITTSKMTDKHLYTLCKKYGKTALEARRKFTGLLPEVYKRRLYEKKGFTSIHEFAAKLGGLSQEQVNRVLRLEKRFEEMPCLKTALVQGEVSVNKLSRLVSIANEENQEELCEKAKVLPKTALETFVRDMKNKTQNGLFKGESEPKSVPGHTFVKTLGQVISVELKEKLLKLHEKGIDINELLLEFLKNREIEIAQEKEQIAAEIEDNTKTSSPSRYIPVKIKKVIKKEFGNKCSVPGCCKNSTTLHHTRHFSMVPKHNPQFLAPLCSDHHKIAHLNNVRFAKKIKRT